MKIGNCEIFIDVDDNDYFIIRQWYFNKTHVQERRISEIDLETILSILFIDIEKPLKEVQK